MQPGTYGHAHAQKRRGGKVGLIAGVASAVVVLLCGGGLLVTALSRGDDDKPASGAKTTTSETAPKGEPVARGLPPKPDAATTKAYVKDLKAIDRDIVTKSADSLVSRGRDQCSSIKEWPDDQAKLIKLTQQRFTTAAHPDGFSEAKAKKILVVVNKRICPSW